MGKGSQTTTSTQTAAPAAQAAYQSLLTQAGNVAATPYSPFGGQGVAPVNAQQYAGVGNVNQYAEEAQPYFGSAGNLMQNAANPLTQQQINQYYSPYQQEVVGATEAQFNNQNAQQQQQVLGNAAAQGALGGDRVGVAQANLAGQQQVAEAPVIAGLESQGYTQALQTAGQQFQQNPEAAAYGLANVGAGAQNAGLTGAGAQIGAGTLEQQTQQAQDTYNYQQYLQAMQYPFATTGWEAGIDTGVGSQMGGTSTTTAPPPSPISQIAGLGLGALGVAKLAALKRGGAVTVPENHATLHEQRRHLVDGHRIAQMFPHGTKEMPLPDGMHRVETQSGVFHFNPRFVNAGRIKGLSRHGRENEVLGLGSLSKHDVMAHVARGGLPVAIVERKPDGTEVRAAAGTLQTAHHQIAEMLPDVDHGNSLHVEDPRHTISRRAFGGRIPGFDLGGSVPYSGGVSWVPNVNVTHGRGAPPPPSVAQQPDAQQMMQNAAKMAGASKSGSSGTGSTSIGSLNAAGQFTSGPGVNTGYAEYDNGTPGGIMGVAPFASNPTFGGFASDASIYRHGGVVGRLPQRNRIEFKRGGMVRAGLGLASFVPHRARGGFADGGTPNDYVYNNWPFADQAMPNFDANGEAGGPALSDAFRQEYPPAPPPSGPTGLAADDTLPPEITGGQSAGVGAPSNDGDISAFAPSELTQAAPQAGVAPSHGGGLSSDFWTALTAAGFGMMASRSPFPGVAIGQGGLQGLETYGELQKQHLSEKKEQEAIDMKVKELNQQAKYHQDELAQKKYQFEHLSAGQQAINEGQKVPPGYRRTDNGLEAVPGGPADPAVLAAQGKLENWKPFTDLNGETKFYSSKTGEVRAAPSEPSQPSVSGNQPQGTQVASLDGVVRANSQMVASGQPYDYKRDAPYIEKGMDVPEPAPVSGRSPRALETDAEYYLQTGKLPPVSRGMSPVAIQQNNYRNAVQNYASALATSRGLLPEQTADMWRTAPGMLRFVLGADGRSTVSLGTAVRHLDTLRQLADAWDANDKQTVNRLRAVVSREFGGAAATNLDAAGKIVGPEIIKAIGVAGAGTSDERQGAAAAFGTTATPAQMRGAIATTQKLLAGQLEGKMRQAEAAGVSQERFKNLIGDRPYELLTHVGGGAAPSAGPVKVQTPADAAKLAPGTHYVTPDGREFTR